MKNLTPREFEVMQSVWKTEPATVNDLADHLNSGKDEKVGRTTVLKIIQRLEETGYLKRDDGRPACYSSTVDAQTVTTRITRNFTEKFFGASPLEAVRCLLENQELSPDEFEELQGIVNQLPTGKGS